MKECPVCKRPDLTDGLERCPQCNADLECFDLLDALREQPADQTPVPPQPNATAERSGETGDSTGELHGTLVPLAPRTGKKGLAVGLAIVLPLLILVLVPLMALVGSRYLDEHFNRLEDRLAAADSRTDPSPIEWSQLLSSMQTLNTRLEGMEQRLSDLTVQPATPGASLPPLAANGATPRPAAQSSASGFSDYHAAPSETLWRIARRFYGKGIYYPVLLEDNPGLAIYGPPDGQTIRIFRQPEHAPETYRRLVYTEGGNTLFRYRTKAGDSWRSLARAFYGSDRRATELAGLNGTPQPESGQRVLVPLD